MVPPAGELKVGGKGLLLETSFKANVASQLTAVLIVMLASRQSASPPHTLNSEPSFGIADNATTVSRENPVLHTPLVQFNPKGLLVTVPDPSPNSVTVNGSVIPLDGCLVNTAIQAAVVGAVTVRIPPPATNAELPHVALS